MKEKDEAKAAMTKLRGDLPKVYPEGLPLLAKLERYSGELRRTIAGLKSQSEQMAATITTQKTRIVALESLGGKITRLEAEKKELEKQNTHLSHDLNEVHKMTGRNQLTTLCHVTINTGHIASIPQTIIEPATLEAMGPLVRNGGGQLPGHPFAFHLVSLGSDAATLNVGYVHDKEYHPLVLGTICGSSDSQQCWNDLLQTARRAGIRNTAKCPSTTPWLGVILLPSPFIVMLSQSEMGFIGAMENWIAWTWLLQLCNETKT